MDISKLITAMVPFVIRPAIEELTKIWDADKELGKLLSTYCKIEDMVGRWEMMNRGSLQETWLQELEGYLYDTEDLVNDLVLGKNDGMSVKPLITPHKIVKLRENMEHVIKLIENASGDGQNNPEAPSDPHSQLSDKLPFMSGTGRDQDKKTIIEELIKCDRSGVSIVGIDGLGKTALARTIMADETIKSHFPLILPVSVSGDFQMTGIVHKLVASYSETSLEAAESHQRNAKLLQDRLCKERALIILNDLWSVANEDWQRFECNYLKSSPGGKILITTPSQEVARKTKSIAHDLGIMTDEDCKKLIMEKGDLSQHECEILAADVEVIAKRCQGLPIIANKLGLDLSTKQDMQEKKERIVELKNCNLWELGEFRQVFHYLNSRESKLPLHLKRCFAYCSLFPLDHEFNEEDLIQLWEVEGFLKPQEEEFIKPEEEINSKADMRKKCFDLSRSILHPSKSRDNQQPLYRMHEFRHWFAQRLASKAFCRVDEGTSNFVSSCKNIRHLSLANPQNIDKSLSKNIEQCKGLRTFLLLHQNNPRPLSISHNFFDKLQSLRLLDLSRTNISTLSKPASLSKHLRYVDLSDSEVAKLPKQIQYLCVLQVLKLRNCSKLLQLPKELNKVISLTHLHVTIKRLGCLPPNMGKLTNLEVLESFYVGKDEGYKVVELKHTKNLTELHIFGLDNIGNMAEAREANLIEKARLKTLVLEWDNPKAENSKEVLEGLQPHNDLNVLKVRNYGGELFPIWLTSPGCHLVSINLENCPNCVVLPTLGQLPILKNLVLRFIHTLISLDDKFCGQGSRVFPCLESLEFYDMAQLTNWTGLKQGDMPCLHSLKISDCPVLFNLPSFTHLSCLMKLEISNCPSLQLLPELPSSLKGKSGKLIITNSCLGKERFQDEAADSPKIKGIPSVEMHATLIQIKSSTQHHTNDKDQNQVTRNGQPPLAKPMKENNISRDEEVSRGQERHTTLPRLSDETHTSKKSEQDPPTLEDLGKERQMEQDEMSKNEHDSAVHLNSADESHTVECRLIDQHEESGSKQPLPELTKLVDEILPASPEYKTTFSYEHLPNRQMVIENSPKRPSSRSFGCNFLRGCFSKMD